MPLTIKQLIDGIKSKAIGGAVYIQNSYISTQYLIELCHELTDNKTVTELHIQNCYIEYHNLTHFAHLLKFNDTIKTLSIVRKISPTTTNSTIIRELTSYDARIYPHMSDDSCTAWHDTLRMNQTLRFLDLSALNISPERIEKLKQAHKYNYTLRVITSDLEPSPKKSILTQDEDNTLLLLLPSTELDFIDLILAGDL